MVLIFLGFVIVRAVAHCNKDCCFSFILDTYTFRGEFFVVLTNLESVLTDHAFVVFMLTIIVNTIIMNYVINKIKERKGDKVYEF